MTTGDPEITGSYLRCAYVRYGCTWLIRWGVGEEDDARAARGVHMQSCLFRFHERHEESP
jgi:hypothetical protein